MGQLYYKVIVTIGFLSLLHTAYSAAQYLAQLRATEQGSDLLPLDIILQGILSFAVAMYGVLYTAGDFQEIRALVQQENKSWETVGNRPSFFIFCHRGQHRRVGNSMVEQNNLNLDYDEPRLT